MAYDNLANIQELKELGFPEHEMHDYTSMDPYKVVENYFQFCQTNLTEECEKYNIQPARIVFRPSMEVNARAGKFKDYSIVSINFGTIPKIFRLFTDNRLVFEHDSLKDYFELDKKLDVSIDYLLFQISTQFTFYHELAHLIQKSKFINNWISESYDEDYSPENDPFSLERHIYEFDADLHASTFVTFHLLDYWKRQKEELRTIANLSLIISLGIAAISSYFIFLMKKYKVIYYNASTHPHPLIRISYILDNMIKVVEHNTEEDFHLNSKEIIIQGFNITDLLFSKSDNQVMKNFSKIFFEEEANIEDYVNNVLIAESKNMAELVMNRKFS